MNRLEVFEVKSKIFDLLERPEYNLTNIVESLICKICE